MEGQRPSRAVGVGRRCGWECVLEETLPHLQKSAQSVLRRERKKKALKSQGSGPAFSPSSRATTAGGSAGQRWCRWPKGKVSPVDRREQRGDCFHSQASENTECRDVVRGSCGEGLLLRINTIKGRRSANDRRPLARPLPSSSSCSRPANLGTQLATCCPHKVYLDVCVECKEPRRTR